MAKNITSHSKTTNIAKLELIGLQLVQDIIGLQLVQDIRLEIMTNLNKKNHKTKKKIFLIFLRL